MRFLILVLVLSLGTQLLAQTPTIGLKNFRSIYFSLQAVTGVKPTPAIIEKYKSIQSRLPKEGRVDEMSNQMLLAVKDLAGIFCKEFASQNPQLSPANEPALIEELSQRIYGRSLSQNENKRLTVFLSTAQLNNKVFLTCAAMTSSIEFLVQ